MTREQREFISQFPNMEYVIYRNADHWADECATDIIEFPFEMDEIYHEDENTGEILVMTDSRLY